MSEIELRPEVQWFAEQMELKLRENDWKGGWNGMTAQALFERLKDEVEELALNVYPHENPAYFSFHGIVKGSVDVANFAMMMAERCREYLEETNG